MGYAEVKIGEIPKEGKNLYLNTFPYILKETIKLLTFLKHKSTKVLETLTIIKHKGQRLKTLKNFLNTKVKADSKNPKRHGLVHATTDSNAANCNPRIVLMILKNLCLIIYETTFIERTLGGTLYFLAIKIESYMLLGRVGMRRVCSWAELTSFPCFFRVI